MLERLQYKESFLLLFVERVKAVIPSSASFASVGCIRDLMVLEVKRYSLNHKFKYHIQISKQT